MISQNFIIFAVMETIDLKLYELRTSVKEKIDTVECKKIAQLTGISWQTIYHKFRNNSPTIMDYNILNTLSHILGMSINELIQEKK